jgi:GxxExxY protein
MELLHNELTNDIIRAYYNVYNELGYGFLERVYQNALIIELVEMGMSVPQKKISVNYKGHHVGDYIADMVVNDCIIVELKACEYIIEDFEYQLMNYLKGTDCEVGLLLNFGRKPEFIRKVFQNENK